MNSKNMRVTAKNPRKTLLRLLSYLKGYELRVIFAFIATILGSVSSVSVALYIKPILNDYILPLIGKQNPDLSGLFSIIVQMTIVTMFGTVANYIGSKLLLPLTTGVLRKIRVDMFEKMQKLPLNFFDSNSHGDIMSRFTNDTDALREIYGQTLVQIISSVLSATIIFVSMLFVSWQMTIPVVIILIVMMRIVGYLGKQSGTYFGKQQESMGAVNGFLEEFIEGQNVVKVFNHEQAAKKDFETINEKLRHSAKGANTFSNLFMPIMMNIGYMNYAIAAMLGSILSIILGLDIGTIASFLQLTRNFNQPISQASQQFTFVLRALAAAERVFNIIDEVPELDEGTVTLVNVTLDSGEIKESDSYTGEWAWKRTTEDGAVKYIAQQGDVVFDHIYFGYTKDKQVLKDIYIYAYPGQKVALVGSTGAGKTTITNLLNRFYDVDEGRILYDGIDVMDIRKDDLRRSLSMVLQDTHLFTGTVKENIRYGNLYSSDEDIVNAAKSANAHDFINTLPEGYETMLSDSGGTLSQGQRQLLSIARAAVSNPPTLVLDEATSSIDTRTEVAIGKGMDKLMEDRTSFVIAHRLSTIRDADVIMVMENGEIIERGNHQQLILEKGRYYQLYTGVIELT